jgi:hypothetical protein
MVQMDSVECYHAYSVAMVTGRHWRSTAVQDAKARWSSQFPSELNHCPHGLNQIARDFGHA